MHGESPRIDGKIPLDYEPAESLRAGSRSRKIVVGLLLIVGVQMWLLFAGRSGGYWGRNSQIGMIAIIAAFACVPTIARGFAKIYDRLAAPSRATTNLLALLIAVSSSVYLYCDARYQDRTFTPKYHDEFSYIIQTRMLAHGRLWQPAHPCADFFDSFQLIAQPVYASIYFPGSALMYVPGVWLNFPPWLMPLILAGIVVALVFRIITELLDLPSGVIAALMMLATPIFRLQALMVMSQIPSMLLALTMFLAWLRWREKRSIGWAIVTGICFGWCAITRPLDALVAAIPIALALTFELRPPRRQERQAEQSLAHLAPWRFALICLMCTLPFLVLQLCFNRAVTGNVLHTPFNYYADKYFPQTSFGFHAFDPNVRPQSALPQKQAYYDQVALPQIKSHTPRELVMNWGDSRLRQAVVANVPTWLTMILMPAGLLAIFTDRRKLVLWLMLPTFVILYAFYTFWLAHYPLIVAAAVVLNILAGAHVVAHTWPRARATLLTFLTIALVALSISELAEFNRVQHDEWFEAQQLTRIDQTLASLAHRPALVLFKFGGEANPEEEPVYNIDVMNPDDAQVIRAHDLGDARNAELFRYYAQRRPDLAMYRYDRADDSIRYLGTLRELIIKQP